MPVLTAMLALVPDQEVDHIVASCQWSADKGTVWHIVAVTGRALLLVDASSPREQWVFENLRTADVLADDEQLNARIVPLADVAAIRAVRAKNVDTFGEWTFNAQWRFTLRDGTDVDIRTSLDTSAARDACDQLALTLTDTMRGRVVRAEG